MKHCCAFQFVRGSNGAPLSGIFPIRENDNSGISAAGSQYIRADPPLGLSEISIEKFEPRINTDILCWTLTNILEVQGKPNDYPLVINGQNAQFFSGPVSARRGALNNHPRPLIGYEAVESKLVCLSRYIDRCLHIARLGGGAFREQAELFFSGNPELIGREPETDSRYSQDDGKKADNALVVPLKERVGRLETSAAPVWKAGQYFLLSLLECCSLSFGCTKHNDRSGNGARLRNSATARYTRTIIAQSLLSISHPPHDQISSNTAISCACAAGACKKQKSKLPRWRHSHHIADLRWGRRDCRG
jgi:hypothetical protein